MKYLACCSFGSPRRALGTLFYIFMPFLAGNPGAIASVERVYVPNPYFAGVRGTSEEPSFIKMTGAGLRRLGVDFCLTRYDEPRYGDHAVLFWDLVAFGVEPRRYLLLCDERCRRRVAVLHDPVVCTIYDFSYPHMHRWFDVCLSGYDDLVRCNGFTKFVFPDWFSPNCLRVWKGDFLTHRSFVGRNLCMMYLTGKTSFLPTEMYSERENLAKYMEVTSPGNFVWHGGSGFGISPTPGRGGFIFWMHSLDLTDRCYRYPVLWHSAPETCGNFKFVICYENVKRPGWISERIWQALFGGAVPVYWGAPNIEDYIPRGCYVDRRDFESNEELLEFMRNFTEDDYKLHRRFVEDFYKSDNFLLFSPENFADTVLSAIFPEGYDRHKAFPGERYEMIRRAKHKMYEMGLVTREMVAWALG